MTLVMRLLLLSIVLLASAPALGEPTMFIRARSAPAEVAAPAPNLAIAPPVLPKKLSLAMPSRLGVAQESREAITTVPKKRKGPSLMVQLRDKIVDELPVVNTAVIAPMPIKSPNGTLAGVGFIGSF